MRSIPSCLKWMLCLLVGVAVAAYAKEPKPYQTAKLLQMNSVHCGTAQKSDTSALGEIIGTDDRKTKSEDVLCQEYVLQTDTVVYRVRPKDEKHPDLLPIGTEAQFRIQKDKMLLQIGGDKEREYFVVSMMPRSESSTAAAAPPSAPQAASSVPPQ
jgi:hypothetical protein